MTIRILTLGVLLAVAPPVMAGGPLDGAYAVVEVSPEVTLSAVLVVLQNGSSMGLALLFPEGAWVYGFATLGDTNRVAGTLIAPPDGLAYGSFDLTLGGGSVTGTIVEGDVSYQASGAKFF